MPWPRPQNQSRERRPHPVWNGEEMEPVPRAESPPSRRGRRIAGWIIVVVGLSVAGIAYAVGSAASDESSGGAEATAIVAVFVVLGGLAVSLIGVLLFVVDDYRQAHAEHHRKQ